MLYADDSTLISASREGLQDLLDCLHDYCSKWGLFVNVEKTKVVVFRKGGRLSQNDSWFYGDINLEVVDVINYLGIHLSYTGKFLRTQSNLADRGLRALYALQRNLHELVNPNSDMICRLFDKLVTPVMLYACEIWGFHASLAIERVHLRFCKWLLKVNNATTNEMIYGELGRFPMIISRKIKIIKYWVKIVCGKSCILVKEIYSVLFNATLINIHVVNWASFVKKLINNLGFGEVWTRQTVENERNFINLCTQRLRDQFIQEWFANINNRPSCRLYKELHVTFNFSEYMNIIMPHKHKICLTKFRTRNHRLPIVLLGRGQKRLQYNERLCTDCGVIGDEYHCLFECKITEPFRNILPRYHVTRPNMFKLISLLTSSHAPTVRKLAKFLYLTTLLYNE